MHYRLYNPEDFRALYQIEEICFQPPFRFSRRYLRRLIETEKAATWIAEEGTDVAGFAIVEWAQEIGRISAYIPTVEVLPQHRGRGIGSEVLRRIEGSARAAGASVLWLHVDEKNEGAIRLYQAHGFLSYGNEKHFYAPGRGALIYGKTLEDQLPG
jgi:ribosomal protein S18 acetylase RimI-like enzyme